MRAIVMKGHGGPEVLSVEERPLPQLEAGQVLIEVKAFGLNHAEVYFRAGISGEVAEITGIECVGVVRDDTSGKFSPGRKVVAIVGGMGRSLNGSYAEYVAVPASNVAAVEAEMSWEDLAALPESYATAWSSLLGILKIVVGQKLIVRGATSTVGQAAVNIAAHAGVHVIATTRSL